MEGIVHAYRRSRTRQQNKHMIIELPTITSREAATSLLGKTVRYTTKTGKTMTGQVAAPHGSKGAIRVIFEKGLPGQSLGSKVVVE